jgi:very-short-patch-repair endonuclease
MILARAKALRKNMTDAERRIWYRLRAHRFAGVKFKRQVPIGAYIVDFACLSRKLVVEIDGGQHAYAASDAVRDASIRAGGFTILRFWNHDVLQNTDAVLEQIMDALAMRKLNPSPGSARGAAPPSPRKRGEGTTSSRRA